MLNAQNICISYANTLLDYKNLRFFKIVRTINNSTYQLELPQSMSNIFPIFYSWLFHFDKSDPLLGHFILPLPFIWFDKNLV